MGQIYLQMVLAVLLGGVLGLEREMAGKTAGLRTYALVSLGACLFSLISSNAFSTLVGINSFDPSRIASQIVVGVGFIGAGVIFVSKEKIRGLTTAAGLWVSAAVGMAVAYRLYDIAIFGTALTLVVFVFFWFLEKKIIKNLTKNEDEPSSY